MMEEPPSRQLTVFFIAVMLILMFFLLFAYFFLGQGSPSKFARPGASWRDAEDDIVLPTKPSLNKPTAVKRMDQGLPSAERGRYIPQTLAERNYFAAMDKARSRKKRVLKRRKRREKLMAFLESPLGQNLTATFELAKRGRSDAAKKFINQLLEDLVEMDVEIQQYVVQAAMSIYHHDKDKAGLAGMMVRYLSLAKQHGAAGTTNQQLDDWISEIEGKMGSLNRGSR